MSNKQQIIAIGGGGFGRQIKDLKIEKYIVQQSEKNNPSICFIPTATGAVSYTHLTLPTSKGV